jgi:hypothetical protein
VAREIYIETERKVRGEIFGEESGRESTKEG